MHITAIAAVPGGTLRYASAAEIAGLFSAEPINQDAERRSAILRMRSERLIYVFAAIPVFPVMRRVVSTIRTEYVRLIPFIFPSRRLQRGENARAIPLSSRVSIVRAEQACSARLLCGFI